ncbi:MAG: DUF2267 domain-containing protein, partial [Candidatus Binatia bacterium]
LVRRLTPGEAKDFIAQLPSLMQPALSTLLPGPDRLITKEAIEAEVSQQLNVNGARAAQITAAVATTVAESISTGQVKDIQSQLPQDLRELLSEAAPA